MKLNVGDRVDTPKGKGTILGWNKGHPPVLVALDNPDRSCHTALHTKLTVGKCEDQIRNKYFFSRSELKLIINSEPEISFDL